MLENNHKLSTVLEENVEVNYSSIDDLQSILLIEKSKFYEVIAIASDRLTAKDVEEIRVRFFDHHN